MQKNFYDMEIKDKNSVKDTNCKLASAENVCKNCSEPINGNYCSNCGQPAKLKRINGHYIISEIGEFLFANKGMIYTIKKMLISPGESVRRFIKEDRYRFVKPISFLFITSLIFTLVSHFFHIEAKDYYPQQQADIEYPTVNLFINLMLEYQAYTHLISGLIVAFWIKLFFRKSEYNIFEIFILLCFISGVSSLFYTLVAIIQGLTQLSLINISTLIVMIYYAWAIGQLFDKKKVISYIKAFIICILGYLVIGFLVAFVGIFIDIVIINSI